MIQIQFIKHLQIGMFSLRSSVWILVLSVLTLIGFRMSIYRNSVWIAKGLMEYTRGGFLSASKNFKASDLEVDCTSKQFLITGSNSGIGKQTAFEIAKRGGTVHLVCRNPVSAEETKKEIIEGTNNENIHVHILDLSSPAAVHKFAIKFAQENNERGLHVLVNNAGCMVNKRELTEDNLEKNFATNTLGTYILTESLMPLLLQTGSAEERARVVTVSSGGMLTNKLDPFDLMAENLSPFEGTMAYAQNKRQQVVMTEEWAKKYADVQFTSMHPGWADTPAVRTSMPGFYEKMKDKLRTVEQGADTVVWLAVSNNTVATDPKSSGEFFQDRQIVWKHLPLAWSKSEQADVDLLMDKLNGLQNQFK